MYYKRGWGGLGWVGVGVGVGWVGLGWVAVFPTMGGCIGTIEGTMVDVVSVKYKGSMPNMCSRRGREYVSTAVPFCMTTSLC